MSGDHNMYAGGPAFPRVVEQPNGYMKAVEGMTLRDYFAAHAPKPDEQWKQNYCRERGYMSEAKMLADWNYEYADAMLKQRGESK